MRKISILSYLLIFCACAFANRGQWGLHLILGLPQGEFKDNVDRVGLGISGHLVGQVHPNLAVGAGLGLFIYGSESRREPFSTTIPDVVVEVSRSNNFAFGDLIMQLQANTQTIKPYIEGRFGFNYLWTETTIKDVDGSEDIASSANFDDFTLSYGGGAGMMFQVWQSKRTRGRLESGVSKVFIDVKALYMLGGEAEYLKEGSVVIGPGGSVTYIVSQSKTDLLSIHAGAAVEF